MSKNTDKILALKKRIDNLLEEAITVAESKRIGDLIGERIRKRTILGYGVEGQAQTKLQPLSESYIEARQRYSGRLSPSTRPSRSNLTATGQMLEAITAKGVRGGVEIVIKGQRRGELSGAPSRLSNSDVARYVQKQGRKFFDVTNAERNFLIREVKKVILSRIKKSS